MPPIEPEQIIQRLLTQLETTDLPAGVAEEFREGMGDLRQEIRRTAEYARMTGVSREVDYTRFEEYIRGTLTAVRKASEANNAAKDLLRNVQEQLDPGDRDAGELFTEFQRQVGEVADTLQLDDPSIFFRGRGTQEWANNIRQSLEDSLGQFTVNLNEQVGNFASEAVSQQSAIMNDVIAETTETLRRAASRGETRGLSFQELRADLIRMGAVTEENLERLSQAADPEQMMEQMRTMREQAQQQRAEEVQQSFRGLYGYDVRAAGFTPEMQASNIQEQLLFNAPAQQSYVGQAYTDVSPTQALQEAVNIGAITTEQAAQLQGASDQQITAIVAPALAQRQFENARPGGAARRIGGQILNAGGGGAFLAMGALQGGIDLATPGGRSMVEAGGQAVGSMGSAAGAGVGAAIGAPAGPLGIAAGALIGGQIGGMASGVVDPYVQYINQQRQTNEMFGLSGTGVTYNPLGMLGVQAGEMPQEYAELRRAQIGARMSNVSVSGEEINNIVANLNQLGLSAGEVAESLEETTTLVGEFGMSVEMASRVAASARFEGTARERRAATLGVGTQRQEAAEAGIEGAQFDRIVGGAAEQFAPTLGVQGAREVGQVGVGLAAGFQNPQAQQQFTQTEGPQTFNQLINTLVENPQNLAMFSGNPELLTQEGALFDENGQLKRSARRIAVQAAINMIATAISYGGATIGDGPDDVDPMAFPVITSVAQRMGIPMSANNLLLISQELGRNPQMAEEAANAPERAQREGRELGRERETLGPSARRDRGARGPGEALRFGMERRRESGHPADIVGSFLIEGGRWLGSEIGREVTGPLSPLSMLGIGGGGGRRQRQDLREMLRNVEGGQPALAELSETDMDPRDLQIAGSDRSLADVVRDARRGTGRERTRAREQLQSGNLRYTIAGGDRGGRGYSAAELRRMQERGEVEVTDGGGFRMTRDRDSDRGGRGLGRDSADVREGNGERLIRVIGTDELARLFKFEDVTDNRTSGGRMQEGEARYNRDRRGGKMAEMARLR